MAETCNIKITKQRYELGIMGKLRDDTTCDSTHQASPAQMNHLHSSKTGYHIGMIEDEKSRRDESLLCFVCDAIALSTRTDGMSRRRLPL